MRKFSYLKVILTSVKTKHSSYFKTDFLSQPIKQTKFLMIFFHSQILEDFNKKL